MTSPSRLRVVVVGAGLMGRWHGWAARRAGGVVVGVVDPDEDRAHALAGRLGAEHVAASLDELLTRAPADIVHVCTPLPTHVELASTALAGGCHVLVEKPFAGSSEEARGLLEKADRAEKLICPVHQFLFQRGIRRVQARAGSLGPLRHMQLTACSAGAHGRDALARDRVALEILPHFLSLVARLASSGRPVEWEVCRPHSGELRVTGLDRGTTFGAVVSMTGRPTRNEFAWIGERGSAHVDLFHGFAVFERGGASKRQKVLRPFGVSVRSLVAAGMNLMARTTGREPAYPGLLQLSRRFYQAVREGGESPISREEVLSVCEGWDRIRRSLAGVRT